jgi:intracellular sulfur oxidation DsrE/DsrF family protein
MTIISLVQEAEMQMRRFGAAVMAAVFLAVPGPAWTQALPVPGVEAARDLPGAKEIPDATTEYKVLFDAARAPEKLTDVNPILTAAARYINTLAKVGVPAANRKIAVVFHQGATPAILKNDEFRKRNNGQDNPNIAIIQALKKAGVEFHVCGQAVLGAKIDPSDIQPEIQVDLWALTTIINMELRGYVRIGG